MRYYITEEERKRSGSTSFIEFQRGMYDGECWHIDSICMDEDMFFELGLRRLFSSVLPQFDYYGITQVSSAELKKLQEAAVGFNDNNDASDAIRELSEWIGGTGDEEILFTICGM